MYKKREMSYKAYVSKALGRDEMKEKNRNAPPGLKYCNAICQEFQEKTKFTGQQVICNRCRNMINLAERKIGKKEITIGQFIENPRIVYGLEAGVVDAKKTCETCKNEKSIMAFEHGRKHCNECRRLEMSKQHQDQLPGILSDIEKLKTNLVDLERYLQFQPKNLLILIMAHYQTGRTSADIKSTMIVKILNHFRSLLTPNLCKTGCGATVAVEHSTCLRCTNRPIVHSVEKRQAFIDNLDQMVENMEVIDHIDRYNKDELSMIAKKFELDFTNMTTKGELFERINQKIVAREDAKKKEMAEKALIEKNILIPKKFEDLVMDEFRIQARSSDGFINATQMCQAGGKFFKDWFRLESTKNLIEVLQSDGQILPSQLIDVKKGNSSNFEQVLVSDMKIHIESSDGEILPSALVDIKKGGNDKTAQGSWIHPDLAVNLAQWISPVFGLRVSRWVREIVITGSARLEPKSDEELLKLQMELQTNQEKLKKLEMNHKRLLKQREYHKFQKGPCFYIIRVNDKDLKIGYEGVDINERFRAYRTSIPKAQACSIIFTYHASFVEQGMLNRFSQKRVELNHEFITDVSPADIVHAAQTLLQFCNMDFELIDQDAIDKYNES